MKEKLRNLNIKTIERKLIKPTLAFLIEINIDFFPEDIVYKLSTEIFKSEGIDILRL